MLDQDAQPVARLNGGLAIEIDIAVDLRRVPGRAGNGALLVDLIDDDLDLGADARREELGADRLLMQHQPAHDAPP